MRGRLFLPKAKLSATLHSIRRWKAAIPFTKKSARQKPKSLRWKRQIRTIEMELPSLSGDALEARLATYQRLTSAFEHANGYAYKSELTGVLKGLGFTEEEFTKPVDSLSGGQRPVYLLANSFLPSLTSCFWMNQPTTWI